MDPIARIIDANLNRAREGLRVLEDLARFALNWQSQAERCKSARHELVAAIDSAGFGASVRIAARDTEGDVGTHVTVPGEYERGSILGLIHANAGRAAEAARVLEECLKTAPEGRGPAARVERLRYDLYEIEKALALGYPCRQVRQWKLCVLITEELCTHMPWSDVARAALAGGADCVQLREKNLDAAELVRRGRTLLDLTQHASLAAPDSPRPSVIINDRPDVALAAGADGVHIGQTDLPIPEVRKFVGVHKLIGASTSRIEEARAALDDGADYCGLGPMFRSTTKIKARLAGPEYLRQYLSDERCAAVPHLAISGITVDNIPALVAAGCRGVAVSSVVCSSTDPGGVCRRLLAAMDAAEKA